MLTSTFICMPTTRKALYAVIRDTEYQVKLRALRKRPGCEFDGTWTNIRNDPIVWQFSVDVRMPIVVCSKEDAELIRQAKDGAIIKIDWI